LEPLEPERIGNLLTLIGAVDAEEEVAWTDRGRERREETGDGADRIVIGKVHKVTSTTV
jgi:hypothetical protein